MSALSKLAVGSAVGTSRCGSTSTAASRQAPTSLTPFCVCAWTALQAGYRTAAAYQPAISRRQWQDATAAPSPAGPWFPTAWRRLASWVGSSSSACRLSGSRRCHSSSTQGCWGGSAAAAAAAVKHPLASPRCRCSSTSTSPVKACDPGCSSQQLPPRHTTCNQALQVHACPQHPAVHSRQQLQQTSNRCRQAADNQLRRHKLGPGLQ